MSIQRYLEYLPYVGLLMLTVFILGLIYMALRHIYYSWHPKPEPKSTGRLICHRYKTRVKFTFQQICWECYQGDKDGHS